MQTEVDIIVDIFGCQCVMNEVDNWGILDRYNTAIRPMNTAEREEGNKCQ